jgi:hypothetical protein
MTQNLARILDEAEQLSVAEREELAALRKGPAGQPG